MRRQHSQPVDRIAPPSGCRCRRSRTLPAGSDRKSSNCESDDCNGDRRRRVPLEHRTGDGWPDQELGCELTARQSTVGGFESFRGDDRRHLGLAAHVGDDLAGTEHHRQCGEDGDTRRVGSDHDKQDECGQYPIQRCDADRSRSVETVRNHSGRHRPEQPRDARARHHERDLKHGRTGRNGEQRKDDAKHAVGEVRRHDRNPEPGER